MIRFNLDPWLDVANQLVEADEASRALLLLNNLPAYYRDNTPMEVRDLRSLIMGKVTLPHDLLGDSREIPKSDKWSQQYMNSTMRGVQLKKLVSDYNAEGIEPHLIDMGPGDYTFPIGMAVECLKFTYQSHTLNRDAEIEAARRLGFRYGPCPNPDSPRIFIAFEIIEHLHHVDEIRQMFDRFSRPKPKHVMLSTPKYTFAEGTPNWKTEGIHHLRAYTPKEFADECIRMFPEYTFAFADDPVMVLIGKLKV